MQTAKNDLKNAGLSVLIIAKSDRRRCSLKFLLETRPELKVVGQADGSSFALELARQYRPDLIVLDTNLSPAGAWQTVLNQVKTELTQTRCLVLTDPSHKLPSTNADAVLMKGFSLDNLFVAIEKLFS